MTKRTSVTHQFVDTMPDALDEGVVYVSLTYDLAMHRCCCGCGLEVVTPLNPARWELTYNGVSISLYPSIGNWEFPCQSHYWIRRNQVVWDKKWSRALIEKNRARDQRDRERYLAGEKLGDEDDDGDFSTPH